MKTKLTKTAVDALKKADRRYSVRDSELQGFLVEVMPSGEKTWKVEYRPYPGGRGVSPKRLSLGPTTGHTADEARKWAKDQLADVAKGKDPLAEKTSKRAEKTISDLINLYEKEGATILSGKRRGQMRDARSMAWAINALRHHVQPLLGRKRITEVTKGDVEAMVEAITAGKTAKDEKIGPRRRIIVSGGEGTARKVARNLSALFGFAIHKSLATSNPVASAAINKVDGRRDRFLTLGRSQAVRQGARGAPRRRRQFEGIGRREALGFDWL